MATQPQPVVAGQSTTLPPAYSEKQDLGAGGINQQPVVAGYVYPQPTAPQAWPQGYLVSKCGDGEKSMSVSTSVHVDEP